MGQRGGLGVLCAGIMHSTLILLCAELFQSCLTLFHPMDFSLPGYSVHEILQARILEWVKPSFRASALGTSKMAVSLWPSCISLFLIAPTGHAWLFIVSYSFFVNEETFGQVQGQAR